MSKFLTILYVIFAGIGLFGGGVIFLFLAIGMLIGGENGEGVMILADNVQSILIQASSIAVIIGMVILYIKDDHDLTLKKKNKEVS